MLVRISKKGDQSIIADDHCRLGTPPPETPPPKPPPTPPPLTPTDDIDDLALNSRNLRISLFQLKEFVHHQENLQETEVPCASPEVPSTPPPVMNFNIFKDNIETSLQRDVKVTRKSINPLELYLKSNPNLLVDKNSKRKEKTRFRFTKLGAVTAVPVLPAINTKNKPVPQALLPLPPKKSPPPRMQRAGSDPGYRLPKMTTKSAEVSISGGQSTRRVSSADMGHLSDDFEDEGFLSTSSAPVSDYKRLW